jgi:hypothetical protein
MLRKRLLAELVNDELKDICQLDYARHRSFRTFPSNLMTGLIAYSFLTKKTSTRIEDIIDKKQMANFV